MCILTQSPNVSDIAYRGKITVGILCAGREWASPMILLSSIQEGPAPLPWKIWVVIIGTIAYIATLRARSRKHVLARFIAMSFVLGSLYFLFGRVGELSGGSQKILAILFGGAVLGCLVAMFFVMPLFLLLPQRRSKPPIPRSLGILWIAATWIAALYAVFGILKPSWSLEVAAIALVAILTAASIAFFAYHRREREGSKEP